MRSLRFITLLLSVCFCIVENTHAAPPDEEYHEQRIAVMSQSECITTDENHSTGSISQESASNNSAIYIAAMLALTQLITLNLYLRERGKRKKQHTSPNKENELQLRNQALSTSICEHVKKENRSQEILHSQIEIIRKLAHIVYLYSHDAKLFHKHFESFMQSEIACLQTLDAITLVVNETGGGVIERLRSEYPELSLSELHFCALVFAGFTNQEICSTAGYNALNTVYVKKHRIRNKLGIEPNKNLKHFLTELAAGQQVDKYHTADEQSVAKNSSDEQATT